MYKQIAHRRTSSKLLGVSDKDSEHGRQGSRVSGLSGKSSG